MSSSLKPITLFDITSKLDPPPWSFNTWKARLVLNYKQLPYKTIWLSYPDIEPTLSKLGATTTSQHPEGPAKPYYTLPVILDENGEEPKLITDSLDIAIYLDEKYPEKPVLPKQGVALEYAFERFFRSTVARQLNPFINLSTWRILDERGQIYFRETREKWEDMRLEDESPPGPIRDGHWKALEDGFDKLATVLDKNGPDGFVAGGTEPTRADFIIISHILWIKAVLGKECEDYGFSGWNNGRWAQLLKKTEAWQAVH
ncbi:hypothetical protein M422DRAFT_205202 [Sphaerobolus stellatus SS14]|nr:hypothetical protein M422DRAFT_205202 [Sphaerobolus stellatus SS14]